MSVLDQRQPADAGPYADADLLEVFLLEVEARVLDRIDRGGETVMDERVEAARLFRREPFRNFKAFDFPGDLAREFCRVETRDQGDAGFAGDDASP